MNYLKNCIAAVCLLAAGVLCAADTYTQRPDSPFKFNSNEVLHAVDAYVRTVKNALRQSLPSDPDLINRQQKGLDTQRTTCSNLLTECEAHGIEAPKELTEIEGEILSRVQALQAALRGAISQDCMIESTKE